MPMLKSALAASMFLGSLALAASEAEAMPTQGLGVIAAGQSEIQDVYYGYRPVHGWRRPFYRRPLHGYGWQPYGRRYG